LVGRKIDWKGNRNAKGYLNQLSVKFINADGENQGIDISTDQDSIIPIAISANRKRAGDFELKALPYLKNIIFHKPTTPKDDESIVIEEIKLKDSLTRLDINGKSATFPLKMHMAEIDTIDKGAFKVKIKGDAYSLPQGTTEIYPLIIIDGQILSRKLNRDELNNLIDPKRIESVNILKGEQAIQKYGAKARDGAIEIITKEIPKEHIEKLDQNKAVLQSGELPENVFYMLNGKYSTKAEIEKLNPDDILSINILKGKNATDKYGSLGKNGVIEIHTKVF